MILQRAFWILYVLGCLYLYFINVFCSHFVVHVELVVELLAYQEDWRQPQAPPSRHRRCNVRGKPDEDAPS